MSWRHSFPKDLLAQVDRKAGVGLVLVAVVTPEGARFESYGPATRKQVRSILNWGTKHQGTDDD